MTKKTLITGFPRIGEHRELKKAVENYWAGKSSLHDLESAAYEIRKKNWLKQKAEGIDFISSNDFSFYDNMLDTALMLNAVPERFRGIENKTERYFAMARGTENSAAMEMTKWFNTNYHYIVPELDDNMELKLDASKILKECKEALALGIRTKINIIGPLTFLSLSKTDDKKDPLYYLQDVLKLYRQLIETISNLGDTVYLQIEEPVFVKDPDEKILHLIKGVYSELSSLSSRVKIIVSTYFEHASEAVKELAETPVWGIALDFVYGEKNFQILDKIKDKQLIAGIVDGRNIWKTDYQKTLDLLKKISAAVPKEKITLSTSCSLLHTPYTVKNESENEINKWMAFCCEKVEELSFLREYFYSDNPDESLVKELAANTEVLKQKKESALILNSAVSKRLIEDKNYVRVRFF